MHLTRYLMMRIVLLLFVLSCCIFLAYRDSPAALASTNALTSVHTAKISNHPLQRSNKLSLNPPAEIPAVRKTPDLPDTMNCPCGVGDLKYHNGVVQTNPRVYLIFWGSSWKDKSGNLINAGQIIEKYFQDVGSSSYENILTQYYMQAQNGSRTYIPNTLRFVAPTHIWIDTSSITPIDNNCTISTVEDSTIQGEVSTAIKKNGWPILDINTTYFVYTPSGYAIRDNNLNCSNDRKSNNSGFCGYHSWTPKFIYAALPFTIVNCFVSKYPNNDPIGDSLTDVSAHEQFEAITDPEPGNTSGGQPFDGWYDQTPQSQHGPLEIGDKCNFYFPFGITYFPNSDKFYIQTMFSDATSSCANASASYQQTVYVGASDRYMYAINAATGKRKWRYATGNTPSTAVVVNGVLYFGSDAVYALNASNGKFIWRYATTGNTVYTPAIANGVVYAGANDGYLYALNANTGALLWHYQAAGSNENVYAPLVDNGAVYFTSPGYTFAVNASTGALIWQVTYYAESAGIAVGNNKVYLTENNYVYALNESDGSLAWQSAQEESYLNIPVVANGVVYASGSSGELYALNADTGAFLWIFNSSLVGYYSVPAVVNGMIYIGFGNDVEALAASNGTLLWTYSTGNHIVSTPAVDQGFVYFGSDDSYVYSLNAGNNGSLVWRYQTSIGANGVVGSPIIAPYY